jgi:hypothetical protein
MRCIGSLRCSDRLLSSPSCWLCSWNKINDLSMTSRQPYKNISSSIHVKWYSLILIHHISLTVTCSKGYITSRWPLYNFVCNGVIKEFLFMILFLCNAQIRRHTILSLHLLLLNFPCQNKISLLRFSSDMPAKCWDKISHDHFIPHP